MTPTKSPVLEGTDLLRVALGTLNLEEIEAHIKAVETVLMQLAAAYGMPGYASATARISAAYLEKRLRAHLEDAIGVRELRLCEEASLAEEVSENRSLASTLNMGRVRRR